MSKSDRMFLGLEHRSPDSDRRLLGHRNGFSRLYRLDRYLIFLLFECLLHSIIPSKRTASCEAYLINSTFGKLYAIILLRWRIFRPQLNPKWTASMTQMSLHSSCGPLKGDLSASRLYGGKSRLVQRDEMRRFVTVLAIDQSWKPCIDA